MFHILIYSLNINSLIRLMNGMFSFSNFSANIGGIPKPILKWENAGDYFHIHQERQWVGIYNPRQLYS